MNYGKPWQARKRFVLNKYSKSEVHLYHGPQRAALRTLLKNLLDDPDNFTEHLRLFVPFLPLFSLALLF